MRRRYGRANSPLALSQSTGLFCETPCSPEGKKEAMGQPAQGKASAAKPSKEAQPKHPVNLWAEAQRLTKEEFTWRYGAVGVKTARRQADAAGATFRFFKPKKQSVRTVSGGLPGLGKKN